MKNQETKHTKGKWVARFNESEKFGDHYTIHTDSKNTCAFIRTLCKSDISIEEAKANAKLIEAAPEMLEALKLAMAHLPKSGKFGQLAGEFTFDNPATELINNLIKKITE